MSCNISQPSIKTEVTTLPSNLVKKKKKVEDYLTPRKQTTMKKFPPPLKKEKEVIDLTNSPTKIIGSPTKIIEVIDLTDSPPPPIPNRAPFQSPLVRTFSIHESQAKIEKKDGDVIVTIDGVSISKNDVFGR